MSEYVITCCSTVDMTENFFSARNIPFICFHFTINGKQYPDDLGKTVPFEQFYGMMKEGATPFTSQVNIEEFIAFFEPYLKDGNDVLHVSLSSGISGAYNSACVAQKQLAEKYPQRKIAVVDSLGASSGYGLLMDMLADVRDGGASFEQARAWAEENKLNVHHWFFSSDLTFYIKGGRISKAAGMLGTILGICPLLNMDAAGHLIPREKIRSKKKVIREIVERMKQYARGRQNYDGKCFISESACMEDARAVAGLVEAAFPKLNGKVLINSIGTVIGSHTGPGTLALYFIGDRRTDIAKA